MLQVTISESTNQARLFKSQATFLINLAFPDNSPNTSNTQQRSKHRLKRLKRIAIPSLKTLTTLQQTTPTSTPTHLKIE